MNDIYETIVRSFWEEHKIRHFTQCERDLFFYLLGVWTEQKNSHPFVCISSHAERDLDMPRKTIMACRKKLTERGIISYQEGKGKGKYPYYFFSKVTVEVTVKVTDKVTVEVTVPKENIPPTPPLKENNNIYYHHHQQQAHTCAHVMGLEGIKEELQKSDMWIEAIQMSLFRNYKVSLTKEEITDKIPDFTLHLASIGNDVKTVDDAKRHFLNWVLKQKEIEKKNAEPTKATIRTSTRPSFNNFNEAEARHVGGIQSIEL